MAIGVVAILSGIIIPLVMKSLGDAGKARAMNDLVVIAAALASQLKDTGSRPLAAGGPGGCTGMGDAIWFSAGAPPELDHGPLDMHGVVDANNSFTNLFTVPGNAGNALFGLPAADAHGEVRYRGPYLGRQAAEKTDPWGRAYLILGYNRAGQAGRGPIWVVCAGPGGTIADANFDTDARQLHVATWDYALPRSTGNLALRVD